VHFRELLIGFDVDVPVHKPVGKPYVQTLLADGETQLVVRYHREGGFLCLVEYDNLANLSRAKRILDEGSRVGIELENVDLFAFELPNDSLDPNSFEPDTGPDRVYVRPARIHGNLGSISGLPDNLEDFHGAVVDFRHFEFEDFLYELWMRPREDD